MFRAPLPSANSLTPAPAPARCAIPDMPPRFSAPPVLPAHAPNQSPATSAPRAAQCPPYPSTAGLLPARARRKRHSTQKAIAQILLPLHPPNRRAALSPAAFLQMRSAAEPPSPPTHSGSRPASRRSARNQYAPLSAALFPICPSTSPTNSPPHPNALPL